MLRLIVVLIITLSVAACGLNSKGGNENAGGYQAASGPTDPDSTGPNTGTSGSGSGSHGLTCPDGFNVVSAGNGGHLCSNGQFALGPFPYEMSQRAHSIIVNMNPYDGTPVPNDYYIEINLAKQAFGNSVCPLGSTFDPSLGFCSDGTNSFGPFTTTLIQRCVYYGGGDACGTTQWSSGFLYSLY